MSELTKMLKSEILKSGYKQWYIAKQIGVPSNDITQYTTGRRKPKPETLRKFEKFFGLPDGHFPNPDPRPTRTYKALSAFGSMPIPKGADVGALVEKAQAVVNCRESGESLEVIDSKIANLDAELDKWK